MQEMTVSAQDWKRQSKQVQAEIYAMLDRLDAGELALTGSILNHFPVIRARVTELCKAACPNMEVIEPHGTPAQGAAMLARKLEQ